jgi:hypothetical protein
VNLSCSKIAADSAFIEDVYTTKFDTNTKVLTEIKNINPEIYAGLAEFTLVTLREPRNE